MINKSIRDGMRTGTTFAVVIVFLALTGFTVTGASLIAKIVGHAPQPNQLPSTPYLIIFMALLALWNGSAAAKPGADNKSSYLSAIIAGLAAGLLSGVITVILVFIYGSLLAQKVDPRTYLSMVSPDSMKLFLLQLEAVPAALIHLAILVVFSVVGSLTAEILYRFSVGKRIAAAYRQVVSSIRSSAVAGIVRRSPSTIYIVYILITIVMIFLPRQWGSYWNYIIGTVGIYVILGLGLNIITGLAGQLVLGYVAFFAIGAYTVALLTAAQPHHLQWNFWIVLVIGVLLSGLTGILLGLPILRLRGDYLAIVTLGFGEIIRIMLRSDLLTPLTAGPKGVRDIAGPTIFGRAFTTDVDFLYLILLAMLLIIFITNRLQNSRAGRAWVAIREDEIAARATGINTFQSKLLALAIGAAFAGLAGVLFASRNQFTGPEDHSLMVSINVLALVIVGGMGSLPGIILGAFALKGLPEILRELESYRLMVFGALLVVMMILRPEGLWPASRPRLEKQPGAADKIGEQSQSQPGDAEGVKNASQS
jgi:ABC-type branched-subunit amino acid transport system permease subunit